MSDWKQQAKKLEALLIKRREAENRQKGMPRIEEQWEAVDQDDSDAQEFAERLEKKDIE